MKTTTVEAKAAVMRRMKMITLTLVRETNRVMSFLAFIDDEEEVQRPATTRIGRATTRSEIDFSFFYFCNEFRASWHISLLLTFSIQVKVPDATVVWILIPLWCLKDTVLLYSMYSWLLLLFFFWGGEGSPKKNYLYLGRLWKKINDWGGSRTF